MANTLGRETPIEFFREQLTKAMEHQRVSTSAFTEFYLVNLLASRVRREPVAPGQACEADTPLALLYVRAMQASRVERARLLRVTGDTALFVSGFFADWLQRSLVDLEYYRAMGGHAYARLSHENVSTFPPEVFDELAGRFGQFADVLWEVSETSFINDGAQPILRLYERWLHAGSRRAAQLLTSLGMAPMNPGETYKH